MWHLRLFFLREQQKKEIDIEIENVVNVIAKTGSAALANRLSTLEQSKAEILEQEEEIKMAFHSGEYHRETVTKLFVKARELFRTGKLETQQILVENFVNKVIVFEDHVEIILTFQKMNLTLLTESQRKSKAIRNFA